MPSSSSTFALSRDPQRVVAGDRQLGEEPAHLLRALQVVLLTLELEAFRVVDGGAGLHAQEGVVSHGVPAPAVVAVVGGDKWRTDRLGDADEPRIGLALGRDAVVLQLDEEVVLAEDVLQPAREDGGAVEVLGEQRLGNDPAEAARRRDETLVVSLQQLPVDAGLVVVPLEVGGRRELDEIAVALRRLGENGQVVVELLAPLALAPRVVDATPAHRALRAGLGGHVGLGPDDGRDLALAALLVEVEDPVHVAVVGDGKGGLAVRDRGGDELADPGGSVEHRVLGVGVQVDEGCAVSRCALALDHHSPTPCPQAPSTACGR